MPKTTAIITTFNRVKFLSQAVESVLAQTLTDFELIVLDNSSCDGTSDVMARYTDPRVRYHRHEAMGISEQRNLGISLASSNYVAFLDDDDVWLPNKLAEQLKVMEQSVTATGLVYGGFRFYDDTGRRWGQHTPTLTGSVLDGLLWTRNPFCGSASNPMLDRRCVIEVGGYDTRMLVGEDWELYLRLAERYELVGVQEVVLQIRQHSGPRLGQRLDAALVTDRRVYRRFHKTMPKDLRSRYLQKIGGKYIRLNMILKGRRILIHAINLNKKNAFAYIQLIMSFTKPSIYSTIHKIYHRYLRRY